MPSPGLPFDRAPEGILAPSVPILAGLCPLAQDVARLREHRIRPGARLRWLIQALLQPGRGR